MRYFYIIIYVCICSLDFNYKLVILLSIKIRDDSNDIEDGPRFDFTEWSPEAPAGLQFLSLIPMSASGYEVPTADTSHVGKIKVCSAHRKMRLRHFSSGKTIGRNMLGMSFNSMMYLYLFC